MNNHSMISTGIKLKTQKSKDSKIASDINSPTPKIQSKIATQRSKTDTNILKFIDLDPYNEKVAKGKKDDLSYKIDSLR